MAKKLTSLDKDIQATQRKLEQLKKDRKKLEDAMFIKIGKLYFEKEQNHRPELTHETLISELTESVKSSKMSNTQPAQNTQEQGTQNQ